MSHKHKSENRPQPAENSPQSEENIAEQSVTVHTLGPNPTELEVPEPLFLNFIKMAAGLSFGSIEAAREYVREHPEIIMQIMNFLDEQHEQAKGLCRSVMERYGLSFGPDQAKQ
jgi:hypothetical protein